MYDESYIKISEKYSQELDLIYSCYKKVVCYLMSKGLSYEDAQDATQEAYMAAIENIDTLEDINNAKNWLFTIAWRRGLRYLNKSQKRKEKERYMEDLTDVEEAQLATDPEDDFAEALGISENHELYTAMKTLRPVERQVLILYYVCEYKYREISKLTRLNESTVRSIASRALEKLRKIMIEDKRKYLD